MTASRKVLLVVEGQHDEAFVAKILVGWHGFEVRKDAAALDPYWRSTVPTTFPHQGDLRRRVPVPMFYESAAVSLAIFPAGGDTNLVHAAMDTIDRLPEPPSALGFVLDADDRKSAHERFTALRSGLTAHAVFAGEQAGEIGAPQPRCGIYVLPDNRISGTLETLLLQCAETNYPAALRSARALVAGIVAADFAGDDLRDLNKPSGPNKATIAAITAILKPGKTLQTSLSDNRWLTTEALGLPDLKAIEVFLVTLLAAPPPPPPTDGPAALLTVDEPPT